ncbi:tetratricopeptide repeat protein [Paenibacillus lutrae]|uniref:Tetratricopeptide repeat protein n=1 Tax=Paenibacillus lutrae TaxID=2078573 RepID=A0A7X3K0D8_9BACL|nr:tetratricopeptide repeat protein [Paenibacillus lutrae]
MGIFDFVHLRNGRKYLKDRNLPKALEAYEKVKYDSLELSEQVRVADLYYELGHIEKALTYLSGIIQSTRSDHAYERRAHILREINREEEAIEDLNEAIRINPDPYMYWYTRGLCYLDLNRYEEAIRDLKECVLREPANSVVSTYYELGVCYLDHGDYGNAEETFRKVLSFENQEIPIFSYRMAKSLMAQGKAEEAASYMRKAVDMQAEWEYISDRGEREVYFRTGFGSGAFRTFREEVERTCGFRKDLAGIYIKMEDYEAALEIIHLAMELFPDRSDLYMQRAILYRYTEQWELAEADLDMVAELDPDEPDVSFEKILIYRSRQQEDKALPMLEHLYEEDPDNPLICYWLAESYAKTGQYQRALDVNGHLLELEEDDPLNEMQRAAILSEMGQYGPAAATYSKAIEREDRADLRSKRSFAYYMESRYDEALMDLHYAAELDASVQGSSSYHHAMGHVLQEMRELEMAAASFGKAIELTPDYAVYYESRAKCLIDLKELEKAEQDCIRGYEKDPSYTDLLSMRGYVRYLMGDYETARDYAEAYSHLHPDSPSAHYNIGLACFRLEGEEDAALKAFNRALELDPGFASCYLYRAYLKYSRLELEETIEDLTNWSLYAYQDITLEERLKHLHELEGLDEDVLEGASRQIARLYETRMYLS